MASLRAAMRRRDAGVVAALRTALSAVANAEAAPPADPPDPASDAKLISQHFAGAAQGLGATEVARSELTEAQVRAIVTREHADLLEHAEGLARIGREDEAEAARRGAAALADALAAALDEQPDGGGSPAPRP